jgi:hypothetical protein
VGRQALRAKEASGARPGLRARLGLELPDRRGAVTVFSGSVLAAGGAPCGKEADGSFKKASPFLYYLPQTYKEWGADPFQRHQVHESMD